MLWWIAVAVIFALSQVGIYFLVRKTWRLGVLHGKDQATEVFDSAMTLLAKRVDDRQATLDGPKEFTEKADQEVIDWSESVVGHWRRLKRNP
jgi:hypothetical protein